MAGDQRVVVGIDPGATKIAAFALRMQGEEHHTAFAKLGKSGGQSCNAGAQFVDEFIAELAAVMPGSVSAWVETPVLGRGGVRSTMVQAFTSGAVQGRLWHHGVNPQLANPSSWKKTVVGKGNATKDEVAKFVELRFPAFFASAAGSQDVIDACCIGLFARESIRRSEMA